MKAKPIHPKLKITEDGKKAVLVWRCRYGERVIVLTWEQCLDLADAAAGIGERLRGGR